MSAGPAIIRKRGAGNRSNLELLNSLRDNFVAAQQDYTPVANGNGPAPTPVPAWTERTADTLYIPRIDWAGAGLRDEANQYEITLKLFFLKESPVEQREQYVKDALDLVRKELGFETIDLLVLSFPGISFEGTCEMEAERINAQQGNLDEEVATWRVVEKLHQQGLVNQLGVAEFGGKKLGMFIDRTSVRPAVNQINLKNCCDVPPPLKKVAQEHGVELNVHTDVTDILPCGTLREILSPKGAGVLASSPEGTDGLKGEIAPRWVVRYVAVVRDRGVVENKGYFAGAEWDER
jgi:glutamate--cysteine ligase regulatory subunit